MSHQSGVYRITEQTLENEWFQVVMVYTGPDTGIRVHVKGKVITKTSLDPKESRLSTGNIVIGRRYTKTDIRYCSSMVDELMLWNRSLTTQEAEQLVSLY